MGEAVSERKEFARPVNKAFSRHALACARDRVAKLFPSAAIGAAKSRLRVSESALIEEAIQRQQHLVPVLAIGLA